MNCDYGQIIKMTDRVINNQGDDDASIDYSKDAQKLP